VQIGAAKLALTDDFAVLGTYRRFIQPVDRAGTRWKIDAYLTGLTGIAQADIDAQGVPLPTALAEFDRFSEGAGFWSWGKDEINMLAVSCFVVGITPPILATRFANAGSLLLEAGMPYEDLQRTRSSGLAAYFNIDRPELRAHDALDDAMSVACTLQHLLRQGKLAPAAFHVQCSPPHP
jgi:DNA polymerase III epsilon subunit-like protein